MKDVIIERKSDHLRICRDESVEFRQKTTLLEEVELLHEALPELTWDGLDLSVDILGKPLRAPIVITAMSGGTDLAATFNRCLATVAEQYGIGLGLGSQRIMLGRSPSPPGFDLRDVAPTALILGNLGAVQLAGASTDMVGEMLAAIRADALAIHLNPAQELVQPEGERDFRHVLEAIERLAAQLPLPVLVKETGCGLGPATLDKLRRAGVRWVDVAGAGGTSWVGVETLRQAREIHPLGELLWDWGIPTAVSTICAVRAGFGTIASGGIRTGLDAARALALGAHGVGLALPIFRAFNKGGQEAVVNLLERLLDQLRAVMLLTGKASIDALRRSDVVLGARLQAWLDQILESPR